MVYTLLYFVNIPILFILVLFHIHLTFILLQISFWSPLRSCVELLAAKGGNSMCKPLTFDFLHIGYQTKDYHIVSTDCNSFAALQLAQGYIMSKTAGCVSDPLLGSSACLLAIKASSDRPTFSFMFLLFLFTEFVQRQLVQINTVQVPGQPLRHGEIHTVLTLSEFIN